MKRKTLIVIPVYGAWDWLELCLKSVADNTIPEHYDIAIVHNPSPEDYGDCLRTGQASGPNTNRAVELINKTLPVDLINISYIPNSFNKGVAKSWNIGIREGLKSIDPYYDSFLMLNSDVVVFENWLASMRKGIYSINYKKEKVTPFCIQPELTEDGEPDFAEIMNSIKKNKPNSFSPKKGLMGPCFMVTRFGVEKLGLFDEGYRYGFWEDVDYFWRMNQLGQVPFTCNNSYVHHYHAKSRSVMSNWDSIVAHNKNYFETKWKCILPTSFDAKSHPFRQEIQNEYGYKIS